MNLSSNSNNWCWRIQMLIELCGHFAAIFRFLDFTMRWSLSLSFSFHPLLCFAELVLPHRVYAVMTFVIVPQETLKSWDISVPLAPDRWAPII
ncbi:hypothetical protein TNCV_3500331 [Trichonephila clavipes]|nr:hypothetical protein TNCV_3500331 [Trichonephila clavipes]